MPQKSGDDACPAVKYLFLGLGIGLAAGFAAGILLAPKPGSETRTDVAGALRTAAEAIKEKLAAATEGKADIEELADELS